MNENPYTSPSTQSEEQPSEKERGSLRSVESMPMTRLEIATLACKILALWMFAQAAFLLGSLAMMLMVLIGGILSRQGIQWEQLIGVAVTGVMPVAMLIVGLFLWFRADWLATRMVPDDPSPVTAAGVTHESILTIAITAIGVFTLASMLRDATNYVVVAFRGEPPFAKWWNSPDFLGLIAGLLFAIWLTFGSRGVARLAVWARTAGRNHEDKPSADQVGDESF